MTQRPKEHPHYGLRLVEEPAAGAPPTDDAAGSMALAEPRTGRPVLLATKLRIPPAYQHVIARTRLLNLLDQGLRRAVTVIMAPAGFGKTTLLGDWSRRTGRPMAWVSLDDGDHDPTRFWSYVIAAMDQVHSNIGESALALLQSPQPPPIEAVLTVLINDLTDLTQDTILVLDDFHLIGAPAIHQAMTFLIDHLPPRAHIILTTRAEPPLPLARWRARGQLVELHASELRFSPDEAAAFLAESMDLHLTAQETAQLSDRTEGWIAGLQLIALSLQKRDDVARVIRELSGAQRFILDYLADEVLARQSEHVQAFLLQTSILERLSGALCDAVTGRTDGQAMLVELERANLFIVPLDDEQRWYRYHHLFAEFLRGRLQAQQGKLPAVLHRRAAQWLATNGLPGDAIGHALAAAEYANAADLIEETGQERLMGGELATLQGWLDRLPEDVVLSRPRLCLLQAWLLTFALRTEQAERYLVRAEHAASLSDEAQRDSVLNEITAIRATTAALHIDIAKLRALTSQAEERQEVAGDDNAFLRNVRHLSRALTLELSGEFAASNQAYQELSASSQASGNVTVAMLALSQLGDQFVAQGRLHRAADTYRQGLRLVRVETADGDQPDSPVACLAHFGIALVLNEWNDLDAAEAHIEAALANGQRLANPLFLAGAYLGLARLQQSRGQHDAALETFNRADEGVRSTELAPWMLAYTVDMRVRSWIAQGALVPVAQWLERFHENEKQGTEEHIYFIQVEAVDQTTLVRALIALGRPQEALDLIEPQYRKFEVAALSGILIELRMLEALAHHALGEEAAALNALASSLAMAAQEGYTRLYIDEGPPIISLLIALKRSITARDESAQPAVPEAYLDHLLAACGLPPEPATVMAPSPIVPGNVSANSQKSPLIEPLSEREREVLRLVADGLTNQDIAATLVVELSTVKTHLLRLYGKLGVHSRTQAVSKARELQLLP